MKKRNLAALAGVLAVCGVGGTWAYFNQTMEVENNFNTGKFGTTVIEDFKPTDGDDWQPGTEINKDVTVLNTGDSPLIVRVKFDEEWKRDDAAYKTILAAEGEGNKILNVLQGDKEDGEVEADDTVVHKLFVDGYGTKWYHNASDGYYYLMKPLAAEGTEGEESSVQLLDAVKLAVDADMGKVVKQKFYSTVEGKPESQAEYGWTAFETKEDGSEFTEKEMEDYAKEHGFHIYHIKQDINNAEGKLGYSGSDYTLKITVDTVQATDLAVKAMFDNLSDAELEAVMANCEWNLKAENNK